MARITIEDCLIEETNRFSLVRLAAKRAKQILLGSKPVTDSKGNRAIVTALREIAAGKVQFHKEALPAVIVNPDLANGDEDDSDLGMSFGIKDSDIFKEKEVVATAPVDELVDEPMTDTSSQEPVELESEEEVH